jgi:hypothetical protein
MLLSDLKRWMYRGQRPNWLASAMNRVSAIIHATGIAPNYAVTLEVTGKKTGRKFSLPLVLTVIDGERYLVSMLGEDVHWVQNVRAAGGRATLIAGDSREIRLEDVPVNQRAPILRAYLKRAPGARPHMPIKKDAPLAEFEKIARDFPVFRIVSTSQLPAH